MKGIFRFSERIADRRPPDYIIGGKEQPYMLRWWVIPRNRWFNIYLHYFLRSDDDRALHDHPWFNVSILLDGGYTEHTIAEGGVNVRKEYSAGAIKFRRAKAAHRVDRRYVRKNEICLSSLALRINNIASKIPPPFES